VVLGAGPVGRAVAARLVERGEQPRVVTRGGTAVPGTTSVTADVSVPAEATAALAGATVVYQCSQPAYHRWSQEFPALQRSIVDGCPADAVLVAIDNCYAYAPSTAPLTERSTVAPTSRKGAVRAAMAEELLELHRSGRLATASVRAADFFGPGVEGSAFGTRFFGAIAAGQKARLLGRADALHSITYVPDIGAAMVRVADEPDAWGRIWHAPTAPAVTQRRLVELAAAAAGTSARVGGIGRWQLRAAGIFVPVIREMIEMEYEFTDDFVVDSSAFVERFGMGPTPLDQAIATTVASVAG
jgi:nucleoside-diphosphate-sugar epimerase